MVVSEGPFRVGLGGVGIGGGSESRCAALFCAVLCRAAIGGGGGGGAKRPCAAERLLSRAV